MFPQFKADVIYKDFCVYIFYALYIRYIPHHDPPVHDPYEFQVQCNTFV